MIVIFGVRDGDGFFATEGGKEVLEEELQVVGIGTSSEFGEEEEGFRPVRIPCPAAEVLGADSEGAGGVGFLPRSGIEPGTASGCLPAVIFHQLRLEVAGGEVFQKGEMSEAINALGSGNEKPGTPGDVA